MYSLTDDLSFSELLEVSWMVSFRINFLYAYFLGISFGFGVEIIYDSLEIY